MGEDQPPRKRLRTASGVLQQPGPSPSVSRSSASSSSGSSSSSLAVDQNQLEIESKPSDGVQLRLLATAAGIRQTKRSGSASGSISLKRTALVAQLNHSDGHGSSEQRMQEPTDSGE